MNLPCILVLLLLAAATGCKTTNPVNSSALDPYTPKQRTTETTLFSDKPETVYCFTQDHLTRMSHTRLDTNRVVRYLEYRWPIQRLSKYCVETNTWPEGHQNLVAHNCTVETDLHRANTGGFDRIWVYVDQDDGHSTNVGEAGAKWHRWTFSLNVQRGFKHWVIIA